MFYGSSNSSLFLNKYPPLTGAAASARGDDSSAKPWLEHWATVTSLLVCAWKHCVSFPFFINSGFLRNLRNVSEVITHSLCLQLWMESEESAIRSCPLCQLTFPTGYPDDALIKHIDSHLENSKIWPFFSFFFAFKELYTLFSSRLKLLIFIEVFLTQQWFDESAWLFFQNFPSPTAVFLFLIYNSARHQQLYSSFLLTTYVGETFLHIFCNRQKLLKLSWREETSWNGPTCALSHTRVLFMSWSCHASQH